MMKRRELLSSLLIPVGIVSSGCNLHSGKRYISLTLINWSENTQKVTVVLRAPSGKKEFEEIYHVDPNKSKKESNIVPAGEYKLSVSLENGYDRVETIQMNGCSEQEITVRPESSNFIAIETKDC